MFQARCWEDKTSSRLHCLSLSHSLGFLASGHTGTFPGQQLGSWLLLYQVRSCLRTGPSNWIFLRGQEKKKERDAWEGSGSRVKATGPTETAILFQTSQGPSLPAPCSPGTCQSPREVGSLSLQSKKGGGGTAADRQALACKEGPGPTSTKTGIDQSVRMPIKPVL